MRTSDLKTKTGLMMGTPCYMSPEQVAGRSSAAQANEKMEKLQVGDADAPVPAMDGGSTTHSSKPLNIIVDANTRLALSHLFDSSAALKRLIEPDKKDYGKLIASPRPSNFLVRMWRDLEIRMLISILL
ncbi:MAG: hypothetical protein ABI728_07105, partial [Betaproteobacteria bacterium]